MRLRISDCARVLALALVALAGCASVGAEFRPYQRSAPRPPMLDRAVIVHRKDVPELARAGAIIVGKIIAGGNGFSERSAIIEAAAIEAARRGGTHLVIESPIGKPAYQPSAPVQLEFMVVRVGDINSMAQLAPRLQPKRGLNYQDQLAINWSEVEYTPPKPLANADVPAHEAVVDGSHVKPLQ